MRFPGSTARPPTSGRGWPPGGIPELRRPSRRFAASHRPAGNAPERPGAACPRPFRCASSASSVRPSSPSKAPNRICASAFPWPAATPNSYSAASSSCFFHNAEPRLRRAGEKSGCISMMPRNSAIAASVIARRRQQFSQVISSFDVLRIEFDRGPEILRRFLRISLFLEGQSQVVESLGISLDSTPRLCGNRCSAPARSFWSSSTEPEL